MNWWVRLFRKVKGKLASSTDVPLPVLVHSHPRGSVPPGPLEEGIIALEQEDVVLHAVAGVIQSDGTIGDLRPDQLEWARRLTYRHLKREGCLAEFGIPSIPAYESDQLPSPPLRGRGVGGEGVGMARGDARTSPSPPTPLPRSGGEGSLACESDNAGGHRA